MAYIIRSIGESGGKTSYKSMEEAKEFALKNIENYENGFEVVNASDDVVVYKDEREEVSREDLIDWDE